MKIILVTDGTKYCDAAVNMLSKFALKSGDEIKIITVVDMALPFSIDLYGGYLPDTDVLENTARENAGNIVDETALKLNAAFGPAGINISSDVLFGSPDGRIVETAEESGADLILIGSHGYNRWERLLLGSISDSVVHHAHCSVLIVRTPVE